jgi:site-specific DNA-cytosine methylase
MRVLVACEFSGTVRRAFRSLGHDAWSCDILPAEDGDEHHMQCDVRAVPMGYGNHWDLMIAHPPCTYLTNAGARWWAQRQQEQADALDFVRYLLGLPIERIAIENPPGRIGTAIRKADQYIQPWQFGHMETKTTGLWLRGLPKLKPTNDVRAEMMLLPLSKRSRVHWMPPGPDRWKERSRTYAGIAHAMAEQWGGSVAERLAA